MKKILLATLTAAIVLIPTAAQAQTKTFQDGPGDDQQNAANSLERLTVTYDEDKIVWRLKIEDVSKKKTQAFATVYWPDQSYIRLETRYRNGNKQVDAYWVNSTGSQAGTFEKGVNARWNLDRDVIVFKLTKRLRENNERADFDAFTVEKGAMHGPYCDPHPGDICNDDWAYGRVHKG